MRYPEKLLTDDETIVREFHPHWRVLLPAAAWLVVAIAAVVVGWTVLGDTAAAAWALTVVAVAIVLTLTLGPVLRWWSTLYVLTTERLIVRGGIVSRRGTEIPLENINDVRFTQTVLERVLGYGDVVLESAGELGQSRLTDIPDPERFQSQVYSAREARSLALNGGAARDPVAQLEALGKLRDQGVISEQEFAAKKQRLLDQI